MAISRSDVAARAAALISSGHSLYLVSNGPVLEELDTAPFGVPVTTIDFLDPPKVGWNVSDFLRAYNRLNALKFGLRDDAMAMPLWVMLDLGLMPSAFLLVTLPRERVAEHAGRDDVDALLATVDELAYAGPIPVAGYCAAPTPVASHWVGWSLCSLVPGLGTVTKALALESYRARTLAGVTQYDNEALRIHCKFGPLRLLAAELQDLHTAEHALVYHTDLYARDHDHEQPSLMLGCHDGDGQRQLQASIASGTHSVYILSPGLTDGRQVPILKLPI